ncbi:MAG: hypothetical protein SGPRY_013920 [Prymnesium sp.]
MNDDVWLVARAAKSRKPMAMRGCQLLASVPYVHHTHAHSVQPADHDLDRISTDSLITGDVVPLTLTQT